MFATTAAPCNVHHHFPNSGCIAIFDVAFCRATFKIDRRARELAQFFISDVHAAESSQRPAHCRRQSLATKVAIVQQKVCTAAIDRSGESAVSFPIDRNDGMWWENREKIASRGSWPI